MVGDNGRFATGMNSRGGITVNKFDAGVDANPERFLIGGSMDGNKFPAKIQVGDEFDTITGIIEWGFGNWRLRPTSIVKILSSLPSKLDQSSIYGSSCELSIVSYNVENMTPNKPTLKIVARHIVENLNSPDIIALQEIQDNSGVKDNGVVACDQVLQNMITAIKSAGIRILVLFD